MKGCAAFLLPVSPAAGDYGDAEGITAPYRGYGCGLQRIQYQAGDK